MSRDRAKRQQFLSIKDLNVFLTDFCKNYQRHDYSTCLQWHSNMSPHLGTNEVKKKHLRRPPLKETGNYAVLTYENDKCANPDSCPDGKNCNKVIIYFASNPIFTTFIVNFPNFHYFKYQAQSHHVS